ncbi:MAG TPA: SgcJ/EcaC family oxidoreductase, partial [Micromonosporaceae bacterium]
MSADPVGLAVRQLYARLLGAWNQRDATAMAACFAPEATMIGYDGSVATGEQIEAHLAPIFSDHPTARYVAKVREVRALGPEVALLRAIVGMIPPGSEELNPAVNAHQTVIATAREQS